MSKIILKGKVVSLKMKKTAVVAVTSIKAHPKYHKLFKVTKRYKAHSEGFDLNMNDEVIIEESKPISKDKRWVVKEVLKSSLRTTNIYETTN